LAVFSAGEILQLNPGYKAPDDYKPLLKETKIPLPVCKCTAA
jgi:splicing factor 1